MRGCVEQQLHCRFGVSACDSGITDSPPSLPDTLGDIANPPAIHLLEFIRETKVADLQEVQPLIIALAIGEDQTRLHGMPNGIGRLGRTVSLALVAGSGRQRPAVRSDRR